MDCPTCGAHNPDDSAYCSACGRPVDGTTVGYVQPGPADTYAAVQPVMLVVQARPLEAAYVAPAEVPWVPGRGQATASMVLGLVGILTGCVPILGLVLGAIGLLLGFVGLGSDRRGQATAGIVLNLLWIGIGVGYVVFFATISNLGS